MYTARPKAAGSSVTAVIGQSLIPVPVHPVFNRTSPVLIAVTMPGRGELSGPAVLISIEVPIAEAVISGQVASAAEAVEGEGRTHKARKQEDSIQETE